jgi:transcriptional regulator with XRE-family HTH domain
MRRARGLSQEQLALVSGVDRSYMGGVERGERNVSIDNIAVLAKALGVEMYVLFLFEEGIEDPASPPGPAQAPRICALERGEHLPLTVLEDP